MVACPAPCHENVAIQSFAQLLHMKTSVSVSLVYPRQEVLMLVFEVSLYSEVRFCERLPGTQLKFACRWWVWRSPQLLKVGEL